MSKPLLIFDMDGVLVEVTESYRETIAQTVAPLHRRQAHQRRNSGTRKIAAAGTTTGCSPITWSASTIPRPTTRQSKRNSESLLGRWHQRPDAARKVVRPRRRPRIASTIALTSPSSPAARNPKPNSPSTASQARLSSTQSSACTMSTITSPHPEGLLTNRRRQSRSRQTLVRRRHRRRCPLRQSRRRPLHRHRRARQPALRSIWSSSSKPKSAFAILDDINELEEVLHDPPPRNLRASAPPR